MSTVTERPAFKIAAMEVVGPVTDHGADFAKRLPSYCRFRYSQAVRFTAEDGTTTFDTELTGLTKPKLAKEIENYKRYIERRFLRYEQCFDGSFSRVIAFQIGSL